MTYTYKYTHVILCVIYVYIYILAVQRTTRLTAHISLWVKMTFLWCICCNQRCNQITATTWVSSLRLWSMSAKMHFILLWTIASCRFWQAHPPTRNSNAKLLFCMVVDAAISSLFCRFCSQPVLGCCFNNSSLKCWLHHLSMTPVVPSLHLQWLCRTTGKLPRIFCNGLSLTYTWV